MTGIKYNQEELEKSLMQVFVNSVMGFHLSYKGIENWGEAADSAYQVEEFLGFDFDEKLVCPECKNHTVYKIVETGLFNCLECEAEDMEEAKEDY